MRELAPSYPSTRLTVDVYCVQHPDRYCVSAKSLAAHLTGLAWALEHGGNERGLRDLQRWLNGRVDLVKPAIPAQRGSLTIADLARVTGVDEYVTALHAWAESAWTAYDSLHSTANEWIRQATSG